MFPKFFDVLSLIRQGPFIIRVGLVFFKPVNHLIGSNHVELLPRNRFHIRHICPQAPYFVQQGPVFLGQLPNSLDVGLALHLRVVKMKKTLPTENKPPDNRPQSTEHDQRNLPEPLFPGLLLCAQINSPFEEPTGRQ